MSTAAPPAGNLYDKQGTTNPVARTLVRRFEAALDSMLERAEPASILDVGCGEGFHAERWAARPGVERVVGLDLPDARLASEWALREEARPALGCRSSPSTAERSRSPTARSTSSPGSRS